MFCAIARRSTHSALFQQLAHRSMASKRPSGPHSSDAAAGEAPAAAPRSSGGGGGNKRQRLLAPLAPSAGPKAGGKAARGSRPAAAYQEPAPGPGPIQLGGSDAALLFRTDLLTGGEAAQLFQRLHSEVAWEQRSVRVMGRVVPQPRLVAYMADGPDLQYTYSGATLAPARWHPAVAALKARVEEAAGGGVAFNSCLLNFYRSGRDSIAWHSDQEGLYGSRPTIASVSLGCPRDFLLRRNADRGDKYRFRLGAGALLVMSGSVQEEWMHSVPRREGQAGAGERISLTFRRIVSPEQRR